jgi:hypothetical protein
MHRSWAIAAMCLAAHAGQAHPADDPRLHLLVAVFVKAGCSMTEKRASEQMQRYQVPAAETRDLMTDMILNGWVRLDGEQVVLMTEECSP